MNKINILIHIVTILILGNNCSTASLRHSVPYGLDSLDLQLAKNHQTQLPELLLEGKSMGPIEPCGKYLINTPNEYGQNVFNKAYEDLIKSNKYSRIDRENTNNTYKIEGDFPVPQRTYLVTESESDCPMSTQGLSHCVFAHMSSPNKKGGVHFDYCTSWDSFKSFESKVLDGVSPEDISVKLFTNYYSPHLYKIYSYFESRKYKLALYVPEKRFMQHIENRWLVTKPPQSPCSIKFDDLVIDEDSNVYYQSTFNGLVVNQHLDLPSYEENKLTDSDQNAFFKKMKSVALSDPPESTPLIDFLYSYITRWKTYDGSFDINKRTMLTPLERGVFRKLEKNLYHAFFIKIGFNVDVSEILDSDFSTSENRLNCFIRLFKENLPPKYLKKNWGEFEKKLNICRNPPELRKCSEFSDSQKFDTFNKRYDYIETFYKYNLFDDNNIPDISSWRAVERNIYSAFFLDDDFSTSKNRLTYFIRLFEQNLPSEDLKKNWGEFEKKLNICRNPPELRKFSKFSSSQEFDTFNKRYDYVETFYKYDLFDDNQIPDILFWRAVEKNIYSAV